MEPWSELINKMKKYLCPPGAGVFTVHTAQEQKSRLHQKIYGTSEKEQVHRHWQKSLESVANSSVPVLLGICSDNGGGILRGANWGPLFIRESLWNQDERSEDQGPQVVDIGDIRVIPHLLRDEYLNSEFIKKCRTALYGDENIQLPVSPLSIAQDFARSFHQVFPHKKLFTLGGDHSVSFPMVYEYLKSKKEQGHRAAIIHFDAHTDLLPERLGVDICFGSWAYHILPQLPSPAHLVQIGIRSSGRDRSHWEGTLNLKQFWSKTIKQQGASKTAEEILLHLSSIGVDEVYVSFDIDAIDSQYAPCTGTPEDHGLAPHEAILILQEIAAEYPLTGADLVEVAPFTCPIKQVSQAPLDSTMMVASSLGHTLLDMMGEVK